MRVAHWTITNGSGMHRVAEALTIAETKLGITSILANPQDPTTWEAAFDADVHIVHTHFPPKLNYLRKKAKLVWVGHGTPDHTYQSAVEEAEHGGYGHSDPLMLMQHWLKTADARVTFWPRHKWIYDQTLSAGARPTDLVPMGVDLEFWKQGETVGKFSGEPSIFTGENPHYIKWVYDLMTALPTIAQRHPGIMHHAVYQVKDHHRALFPWFNQMGATFHTLVTPGVYPHEWLRNAFKSVDYQVGLVRYGDLNHLSLQANAAGCKTISYVGNEHADFWVPEGDQRDIARVIGDILAGEVEPRKKTPVPDLSVMAGKMIDVYKGIA